MYATHQKNEPGGMALSVRRRITSPENPPHVREQRQAITKDGMDLSLESMEHRLEYDDIYAHVHRSDSHGEFLGETKRRRRNQCVLAKVVLKQKLQSYRRSQADLRDTAAELFDHPCWRASDVSSGTRARQDVEMHLLAAEDW